MKKKKVPQMDIKVAVRIRPISEAERSTGSKEIISVVEDNMVCLLDPADSEYNNLRGNRSRGKTFIFDHAFSSEQSSQEDVYRQTTKSLIGSVLEGYNATVLAYGPTGTGKTYTMLGTDDEPGIMVLTLNDLYNQIAQTSNDQKYTVKMSYLEIYNEMIRDLLNPSSVFLDLREDSKGVQVAGLSEYEALTTSEIMKMLSRGNKLRMCEPTSVNKTSSRSHAVLQVTVEQHSRVRNVTEEFKISKLFMIDLAGSERAAITKNTGMRLIEGAHINRSLLALGNCINALTEKGNKTKSYVNYRDSKLTRLLKDSLGGNCKTVMIAHVSPASMSFEESKNTLSYADRAKSIKLKAKPNQYSVNYHVAQYQSIISDLREEIIRLKSRSAAAGISDQQNSGRASVHSAHVLKKLKEELKSCYSDLLEVRKEIIHLEDSTMQYSVEYQRHLLTIDEWNQEQARRQAKEELKLSKQDLKNIFKNQNQTSFDNTKSAQEPADVTVAREEIQNIQNFLEEIEHRKKELQRRLGEHKGEQEFLEKTLAEKVSTEQQKDVLDSLCKIHEFQIKNIELEATALIKEYLLEQKDLVIQRNQMRHNLIEEIVDHQKHIIEENHITYPVDLELLYQMYKDHLSRDKDINPLPIKEGVGTRSQVPTLPALNQSVEYTDENSSDMDVSTSDKFERINIGRIRNKWSSSTTAEQDNMSLDSVQLPTIPSDYVSLVSSTNNLSTQHYTRNDKTSEIQKPERRNTFTLEDQVLKLGEHPSTIVSRKQNRDNNDTVDKQKYHTDKQKYNDDKQKLDEDKQKINGDLEKQLRKRRTFTLETDVESSVSLMTGQCTEQVEDPLERKRSASVGLIREKKSINRKKKLKSLTTQQKKPTWNNNFNARGIVMNTKPRTIDHFQSNKVNKPKSDSNATVRTLNFINNRYNNNNNKNNKFIGKAGKLPQKYSSSSNENQNDILSISGTSYLHRGGFGR